MTEMTTKISQLYILGPPIDNPPGASARVWQIQRLQALTGEPNLAALKVIRSTRMDEASAYQQFADEVEALYELRNISQVVQMYDWGFISSDEMPMNVKTIDKVPIHPNERILSLRQAGVQAFADLTLEAMARRFRPYIVLELMEPKRSLYALMRRNQRGIGSLRRLPVHDVIEICDQYIQLLNHIHHLPRPLFYYDTKPANIYWDGHQRRLCIIDWNVIKRLDAKEDPQWARLVKRDIDFMFYDTLFLASTGVYPPDGRHDWLYFVSLKPRPPLDYGPLDAAIPERLKELLEKGLSVEGFNSLDEVARSRNLRMLASFIGREQFANRKLRSHPDRRQAHEATIAGLTELRQAEVALLKALHLFKQAKQLNPIDQEASWLAEKTSQLKELIDNSCFIHG